MAQNLPRSFCLSILCITTIACLIWPPASSTCVVEGAGLGEEGGRGASVCLVRKREGVQQQRASGGMG
jgi:hypothetical protein